MDKKHTTGKHEYWSFSFHNNPQVFGPIDIGRPVTLARIKAHLAKKHETTLPIDAWPCVPWWLS